MCMLGCIYVDLFMRLCGFFLSFLIVVKKYMQQFANLTVFKYTV